LGRLYTLTIGSRRVEAEVWENEGNFHVRVGPVTHVVSTDLLNEGRLLSMLIDGESYEVYASPVRTGYEMLVRDELFTIEVERGSRINDTRKTEDSDVRAIRSPMAGIVAEIPVALGQTIERGQVVLVLESMKMKNELRADQEGRIEEINVEVGQQVERGQHLIVMGAAKPPPAVC
jgi:biotin carboxyl carrier protein